MTDFQKNIEISNLYKSLSFGSLVLLCGQTHRHDKANICSLQFANLPKNEKLSVNFF
jgi:hypothetical protein